MDWGADRKEFKGRELEEFPRWRHVFSAFHTSDGVLTNMTNMQLLTEGPLVLFSKDTEEHLSILQSKTAVFLTSPMKLLKAYWVDEVWATEALKNSSQLMPSSRGTCLKYLQEILSPGTTFFKLPSMTSPHSSATFHKACFSWPPWWGHSYWIAVVC